MWCLVLYTCIASICYLCLVTTMYIYICHGWLCTSTTILNPCKVKKLIYICCLLWILRCMLQGRRDSNSDLECGNKLLPSIPYVWCISVFGSKGVVWTEPLDQVWQPSITWGFSEAISIFRHSFNSSYTYIYIADVWPLYSPLLLSRQSLCCSFAILDQLYSQFPSLNNETT